MCLQVVEDQPPELAVLLGMRRRRRETLDDLVQHSVDAQSAFGGDVHMGVIRQTERRGYLLGCFGRRSVRQVDFVDDCQ